MLAISPGPWGTYNMDGKYFPSVLLGIEGLVYRDGSGDPKTMRTQHRLTINVGPSPEGAAKGFWSNQMETCQDNARAIAAVPEMLELIRLLSERETYDGLGLKAMELRRKMGDAS